MVEPNSDISDQTTVNRSLFDSAFDQRVQELLSKYHVPGLSVAIVDRGQIHSKGYGVAQFPSMPATAETLYYAGSTTKAFVAAVAGLLIEDPSKHPDVKWSTPLKHIMPDFDLQDPYVGAHTSIEDALSHRSGLPRHDLSYGWTGSSVRDLVKTMRHLPLCADLRTEWHYCNTMYAAVQATVEELEGKPIELVFRERLWGPLGLESTFWNLRSAADHVSSGTGANLARGYFWVEDDEYYVPDCYFNLVSLAGAGANISTVKDYALWVKALLAAAQADQDDSPESKKPNPISRDLFTSLTTPRSLLIPAIFLPSLHATNAHTSPNLYALGWSIMSDRFPGHTLIGHGGGLTGFGAEVFFLPNEDFGVVTMGNTGMTSNIVGEILASELIGRRLGLDSVAIGEIVNDLGLDRLLGPKLTSGEKDAAPYQPAVLQDMLADKKPLPGDITAYAGSYSHPAYGTWHLRAVDEAFLSKLRIIRKSWFKKPADDVPALVVQRQASHIWKHDLVLRHQSSTLFSLENLQPHGNLDDDAVQGLPDGCDGSNARHEKLWHASEEPKEGGAFFELDQNGNVNKMGLVLDGELAEAVRRDGRPWEEGMIWFEKKD